MSLLELQGVSKRFRGLDALRDVSFAVPAGAIVGLIGPNGAGKTTLFNAITGFHRPEAGRILFDGRDITGCEPNAICRLGICRTFQIAKPFGSITVERNVMMGALPRARSVAEARAQARAVLQLVGLDGRRDTLGAELTIGDRKRLELARALATRPRLLLLDEVMGGLNLSDVQEMIALIRRIRASGITVLLIEHIMAAIMALSERIVVLHHGEKIAEGAPAAVAHDRAVVQAYLGEEYLLA